jgi:[protein-PII] uridylyltransferase
MLAVLTTVLERAGVDIVWARVTTLGSSVVDVFGLVGPDLAAKREALEHELYAALPAPPAPKPAEEAS